ncbi:PEP-CTERM sorting domain-containing protein [Aquabacterium soli]|jgi:hypothetical protein|nr:PEP-CTERM sorting domain-containing protein [Aquabacterium soli]
MNRKNVWALALVSVAATQAHATSEANWFWQFSTAGLDRYHVNEEVRWLDTEGYARQAEFTYLLPHRMSLPEVLISLSQSALVTGETKARGDATPGAKETRDAWMALLSSPISFDLLGKKDQAAGLSTGKGESGSSSAPYKGLGSTRSTASFWGSTARGFTLSIDVDGPSFASLMPRISQSSPSMSRFPQAVPEPQTVALGMAGLAAVGLLVRRRT